MKDRKIDGVAVVKHNALDEITGKRKLGFWCKFIDKDLGMVCSDNLNFTLDVEEYEKLKQMLDIDDFTSKTPIYIELKIKDAPIEKWSELSDVKLDEAQQDIDK